MREIAEIELAIQGGTEKIETLGEQGKVEESMREMQAIEALKSEKADKEVRHIHFVLMPSTNLSFSVSCNNSPTLRERPVTKSFACVTCAARTSPSSTPTVVLRTTSVERCVLPQFIRIGTFRLTLLEDASWIPRAS